MISDAPILEQGETVLADMACRACGYNLRGLTETGRCPECGVEVRESLGPIRLDQLPPSWLRSFLWGLTLIFLGLLLLPLSPWLAICGGYCLGLTGIGPSRIIDCAVFGGISGMAIGASLILGGTILCSLRNPALDSGRQIRRLRVCLRGLVLANAGAALLVIIELVRIWKTGPGVAMGIFGGLAYLGAIALFHFLGRWFREILNLDPKCKHLGAELTTYVIPIALAMPGLGLLLAFLNLPFMIPGTIAVVAIAAVPLCFIVSLAEIAEIRRYVSHIYAKSIRRSANLSRSMA